MAPGVDGSRSRRASLPSPAQLGVLWQRLLPGGISANLLVDARGNVFVAGPSRVWQLGPDGRDQYSRALDRSSPVAAALLADDQRVVLGREGTLASWSARGTSGFVVELQLPAGWTRGGLLPLPDGNLLVSAGPWLQQRSPAGELLAQAQVGASVVETVVSGGQILILTEGGELLDWNGRSYPRSLASLGTSAQAAALAGPERLLALTGAGTLMEWNPSTSQQRKLAMLEGAGGAARLSAAGAELSHVLGSNGVLSAVKLDMEVPGVAARSVGSGPGELVTSSDGSVAWLVASAPFTVQHGSELHSLEAVSCAQPASLVPAGNGQLAAACRSGQLWRIGPAAATSNTTVGASGASLPIGTRRIEDLYSSYELGSVPP